MHRILICLAALSLHAAANAGGERDPADASYIWYDGGKPKRVWLDESLIAEFEAPGGRRVAGAAVSAGVRIRPAQDHDTARMSGRVSPVLRDGPSGALRALPGNVIVELDSRWSEARVEQWLAAQGLTVIGSLPIGRHVLLVRANPGLEALELANRLQRSGEVVAAQPEWWQQKEPR